MNKIILIGNLCKDVEIRYTSNNIAVMQNTIAVKNDYKNANGEYDSEFINIVVWRQSAEFINKYASKGSKVLVEGRLTNRTYDKQDGTKGCITEVVAEKVELLDAKKKETEPVEKQIEPVKKETDPFAEFANEVVLTDMELPF